MSAPARALADLSSPELGALLEAGALALWPVGSTEAHGPHLPLATDTLIAEETARRAVPRLEARLGLHALVLPSLSFTVTDFAAPFPGTLTLPRATVVPFVRDVLLGTLAQGFAGVLIVNGHLEPAHRFALRDAVAEARAHGNGRAALVDPADRRFAGRLTEEFRSGSCHAGQYETSLVLAAARGSVRESERARLAPLELDLVQAIRGGAKSFRDAGAPEAYCGDPRAATAQEGERCFEILAEIVVEVATEMLGAHS